MKTILILLLSFATIQLSAQQAGKAIKRHKTSINAATSTRQKPNLSPILQNLIDNMVVVDGGTFTMGATPDSGISEINSEGPAHQVTLSSFRIGRFEVTQEEWKTVMGNLPEEIEKESSNLPIDWVSWDNCQEFIRKLNAITGKKFRLPTEAEWEYAARGGNKSKSYRYAGGNQIEYVAWYKDNSGFPGELHPVGQKIPNELGLYDMSGNVEEWCQDFEGEYSVERQINPKGPANGEDRIYRGGCFDDTEYSCRSACRAGWESTSGNEGRGFRLAQ